MVMTNMKKFTDSEMAEIRLLNEKFQKNVFELGNLSVERMGLLDVAKRLDDSEEKLKQEYYNLRKMEEELLNKLTSKYGSGQLNLTDGTFTPTSE
jgi:F0F1-type ATP synthase gamma subunit